MNKCCDSLCPSETDSGTRKKIRTGLNLVYPELIGCGFNGLYCLLIVQLTKKNVFLKITFSRQELQSWEL